MSEGDDAASGPAATDAESAATDDGSAIPGSGPEVTDSDSAASDTDSDLAASDTDSSYGGVLGAFPYAARATDSRLCLSYVFVGSLLAVVVLVLFLVGVISAFNNTLGAVGGTFTFSRTFVFLVGTVVGVPVIAPILLVARRHRFGQHSRAYDRTIALTGYLYALSLYLALVVSAPPGQREAPPAAIAPVVEALYALPPMAGVVPPLAAIVLMYGVHRRYRAQTDEP